MRVLWLCNIVLPQFANILDEPIRNNGGWLTGILDALKTTSNIKIAIAFPALKEIDKDIDGIRCYGFVHPSEEKFVKYIELFRPDVIHVFGTETINSNYMVKAAKKTGMIDHTVVSIQGLVYICAKHYTGYMDVKDVYAISLKNIVVGNIAKHQERFFRRGKIEKETLKMAKHVIGRTDWDEACVKRINRNINYHFCNEILRETFYNKAGLWNAAQCENHSIFVSQCGYPLKGFHLMLEALEDILKVYPDCILYTTGNDLFNLTLKDRLFESSYSKYLRRIIKEKHLSNNVVFLGQLSETEMCEQFLRSNVFVCCSSIENSPNSLGEAMILGTPCIASDVGGVKNMLVNDEDGYLYPADEPYMCAYYVMKLFSDKKEMLRFSKNASKHARITHNIQINNNNLLSIYSLIK